MQLLARRWDNGQAVQITVSAGNWERFEPIGETTGRLPIVAPGWVDLQVNGLMGIEFTDGELTTDRVAAVARRLDAHGVVRFCPTVTTQSNDVLTHALATLAKAAADDETVRDRFAGIHLEGPYISPEDGPRGAHPLEHARDPSWDEFRAWQDVAEGRIRILTMAPELPGAIEFIRRVVASGVVVAIGHTAADADSIRAAVDAGASMSTHLGNGAHRSLRRHPNYLWDQLAEDGLTASLIVDGFHLPSAVVKAFVRAKMVHRCVLVSDVVGTAGRPPGRYDDSPLGAVEVLEDGRIVIAGQRQLLAGAFRTIEHGVQNVMRFAGIGLADAVRMASLQPARIAGLTRYGFQVGLPADGVLLDWAADGMLQVSATLNRGRLVHGSLEAAE